MPRDRDDQLIYEAKVLSESIQCDLHINAPLITKKFRGSNNVNLQVPTALVKEFLKDGLLVRDDEYGSQRWKTGIPPLDIFRADTQDSGKSEIEYYIDWFQSSVLTPDQCKKVMVAFRMLLQRLQSIRDSLKNQHKLDIDV